jgi:hypothetical protein
MYRGLVSQWLNGPTGSLGCKIKLAPCSNSWRGLRRYYGLYLGRTHESETLQLIDGHFTLLCVGKPQLGEKSGESKDHGTNPRGYVFTWLIHVFLISKVSKLLKSWGLRSLRSLRRGKRGTKRTALKRALLVALPFYLCLVSCDLKNCTKLDFVKLVPLVCWHLYQDQKCRPTHNQSKRYIVRQQ